MIYKTPQSEIHYYFSEENDAISQSGLKLLLKGVNAYLKKSNNEKELYYSEKGHFIIGSAVDTILSLGMQEFQNQYYISLSDKKPGDKTLSLMHYIFDNETARMSSQHINQLTLKLVDNDDIIRACVANEFQNRYKDEAKIKAVYKNEDYFNELCLSNGKQIITTDDYEQISRIVDSFQTSQWGNLFDDTFIDDSNTDIYFQLPIYSLLNGVKVRGLLDVVIVDHDKKTILNIDLKTMAYPVNTFHWSAKKFRYDFQISFYHELLRHWITVNPTLKDYTILNPEFLVESTTAVNGAVKFVTSDEFLTIGKEGRKDIYGYTYIHGQFRSVIGSKEIVSSAILGWEAALDLYEWHTSNGFNQDRIIQENNNIVLLNFGKIG